MSQINKVPPPSPVLPLPPLEYDVAYLNNLVRLLNYFIQQTNNPGVTICSRLEVNDGDADGTDIVLDSKQNDSDITYVWFKELPTSATGLVSGQVWVDTAAGNVLKIVP